MYSHKNYDYYDDNYSYNYKKIDESKVRRDFMNYANPKTKCIEEDGFVKMGKVLGIDIYTDMFITYFTFKCDCTSDTISENEYLKGLKSFGANSLEEVKGQIISIREKFLDVYSEEFKNFYYYLFKLNAEQEKKSKVISHEVYELYFNKLFGEQFSIVKEFLEYMKNEMKQQKLKEDEWQCFRDFLLNEGVKFPKDYNPAAQYPVLIDGFYYWYCKKHDIKIETNSDEDF